MAAAPELDRHDVGPSHPERPARLGAALAGIDDAGLRDGAVRARRPAGPPTRSCPLVHPRVVPRGAARLLRGRGRRARPRHHGRARARGTRRCWRRGRRWPPSTPSAAGRATSPSSPPVHPVTMRCADEAMGFCLLNNIAVAAASLTARGERVLIVDWDVHHGNGTQAIFWDDPHVLYVSTHQWPLYPGTGRADGDRRGRTHPGPRSTCRCRPGPPATSCCRALDEVVAPAVERFAPTWVLVSAGFDAHRADPLAGLRSHRRGLRRHRRAGCRPSPRRRAVWRSSSKVATTSMPCGCRSGPPWPRLMGVAFRPEAASSGGPGADAVDAARRVHADGAGST